MTDDLVDGYSQWMRSWGASPRTIKARQTIVTSRLREWGVDGFTKDRIEAFLGRDALGSAWSRSTYYNHLNDFCGWMVANSRWPVNPMDEVRKPSRGDKNPRPLSESEVERVMAAVEGTTRDWISIALLAGLRASEIAKLRGEDVHADGLYVKGKGGKRVTLPCHPDLWDMAQRYPRHGYWFPGSEDGHIRPQRISVRVGQLFKSLGIEEGSIHRCRHVFGTRLLRSGVHIRTVQRLMRHASLDTTANYTAVDEDEMREAVGRLTLKRPA